MTIDIRSITDPNDIDRFFTLSAQAFGPATSVDTVARDWRRLFLDSPEFDPSQLRGAYRDGALIAGCTYVERWMNLHGARVKVGCIGAVVTDPAFRRQGAANALMDDVNALGEKNGCAFHLLHGFEFYSRWGYADVFDNGTTSVSREAVLKMPPSPYRVRLATAVDAPAWEALFQGHYGHTGGFERSTLLQAHWLRWQLGLSPSPTSLMQQTPIVAIDDVGQPRGYLQFTFKPLDAFGLEPAADDWPAALALLQYHAKLPQPGASDKLYWRVRPGSALFHTLADHFPITSEYEHNPNHGWMARLTSLPAAIAALQPLWRERLQQRAQLVNLPKHITLAIGTSVYRFSMNDMNISVFESMPYSAADVQLSPQVFGQLAFGYRPVSWAVRQPGQMVPLHLQPVLEAFFPNELIWIAPSDAF
jgi:GNAT superfamily N-acetyltransferase